MRREAGYRLLHQRAAILLRLICAAAVMSGFAVANAQQPSHSELRDLLAKIEATQLPDGYNGGTHQQYVDKRMDGRDLSGPIQFLNARAASPKAEDFGDVWASK